MIKPNAILSHLLYIITYKKVGHLFAFCLLRNDYRMFRLDRISKIEPLEISFEPHKLTLKEFLDFKEKNFVIPDIPLS